jgi:hypothetical protein
MPVTNENFANDIRDAVKALMEADPYYFDIPILTERLQDLDAKIDETVALSGGILILLVVVTLGKPLPNLRGAHFDDIGVYARVIESLSLNETGKGAQQIAIYTAALWNQLPPDALAAKLEIRGRRLGKRSARPVLRHCRFHKGRDGDRDSETLRSNDRAIFRRVASGNFQ